MITLALRFPGGRYHATPWGHHVNEGLAEWPPSPWRLLRALIATGFTKLGWSEIPQTGRSLIERLAGVLPSYHLPSASLAHTRHYMPAPVKTTLVFDTWARVGDGELQVTWDAELPADELELFTELAEKMSYLGRSESWVSGRAFAGHGGDIGNYNCVPCGNALPGPKQEQVAVLAPVGASDYLNWRSSQGAPEAPKAKKPKAKTAKSADDPIPPDLLACLQVETQWLQKHGWSQPPGSRRVFYTRRSDALQIASPHNSPRCDTQTVSAMLLSLSTQNRNAHALPPITRTLPQADLLHNWLVRKANPSDQGECPALTGTNSLRKRLKLGHQHAHLLPLDADGDGHLDLILIWAPMGLDAQAQNAVRAVRTIPTKGSVAELHVRLIGTGELKALAELSDPAGKRIGRLIRSSKTWRSLTPFVPPRYMKRSGKNTLQGQVLAELRSRGFPEPREINIQSGEELRRFRHYIRHRTDGNQPPVDCGFALQIRFAEPVSGPMCLGYASHFGLGLFGVEP